MTTSERLGSHLALSALAGLGLLASYVAGYIHLLGSME
jgi:hypothetical protein